MALGGFTRSSGWPWPLSFYFCRLENGALPKHVRYFDQRPRSRDQFLARPPSSGDELKLCEEASALSKPYALLIVQRESALQLEGLDPKARNAYETYVRLKDGLKAEGFR